MKIEKINDNQIRCTLTRADLDDRHLKLSELAYGSEKAKSLFHDMMQQASSEFGFEADDMPLMIEAIPSADSIVLIITKVEDPEELDTRFSKFAPSPADLADRKKQAVLDKLEGAEQLLDILDKVKNAVAKVPEAPPEPKPSVRLFSFGNLDSVIEAAHLLSPMYDKANSLYKDHKSELYILAVNQSDLSDTDFNRICNMLTEYGSLEKAASASLAYLEEHCKLIVSGSAVQTLAAV